MCARSARSCATSPSRARADDAGEGGADPLGGGGGGGLAFQCPPTLRVQLPSARGYTARHVDADYAGHQGEEVNWWLPLSDGVGGNNSLWVETRAGARDFRPLRLRYGEAFRFDGGAEAHECRANDTGATRVSIDFRVIARSRWRDEFGRRMGAYPCETTPPLELEPD